MCIVITISGARLRVSTPLTDRISVGVRSVCSHTHTCRFSWAQLSFVLPHTHTPTSSRYFISVPIGIILTSTCFCSGYYLETPCAEREEKVTDRATIQQRKDFTVRISWSRAPRPPHSSWTYTDQFLGKGFHTRLPCHGPTLYTHLPSITDLEENNIGRGNRSAGTRKPCPKQFNWSRFKAWYKG